MKEAIILAGGFGTRLQDALPGIPKCMAPVNDRPFLFYLINYLRSQGIEKFIFSLGYKHEIIEEYLNDQFSTLDFQCSVEKEPLGTGGAILAASYKASGENAVVVNGDTLFKVSIPAAEDFHLRQQSDCTLLLKPMRDSDRYGLVELNSDNTIRSFREKQKYSSGNINGGTYLLNLSRFMEADLPEKFSFEKDYLEKFYKKSAIYGIVQDGYFIDIGIPEDYYRAREEFRKPLLEPGMIDKTWTIFLDRDGVINHEKEDDYVRSWGEFEFYTGAREAIRIFSEKSGPIIVVSNQRGVGRGLMTEEALLDIHDKMKAAIELSGGRIDQIYYCTSTDPKHPDRKPNPGMVFRAQKDFPGIDLSRAIIAGNKPGDMLMGRNAGLYTVFIAGTPPGMALPHPDIDLSFNSLIDFAKAL